VLSSFSVSGRRKTNDTDVRLTKSTVFETRPTSRVQTEIRILSSVRFLN
jgi:hypothetical protein